MAVLDDNPKPEMSDAVAQELGRYMATFNWMEWIVIELLHRIVDAAGPLDAVTARLMFRALVEATKSALALGAKSVTPDLRERLTNALDHVGALAARRNEFAHGSWFPVMVERFDLHGLAARKFDGTGKFMAHTAESVRLLREELERAAFALASLVDEYDQQTT